jgi:hypothetical protein
MIKASNIRGSFWVSACVTAGTVRSTVSAFAFIELKDGMAHAMLKESSKGNNLFADFIKHSLCKNFN